MVSKRIMLDERMTMEVDKDCGFEVYVANAGVIKRDENCKAQKRGEKWGWEKNLRCRRMVGLGFDTWLQGEEGVRGK